MRITEFTDLTIASYFGHDAIVRLCLDNGAEVDSKDSEYGRTPLSWASKNGHKAVVPLLLDKGAEADSKDDKNRTPLSWACENGHKAIVPLLLDKGAEVDSKDSEYDQTPLSRASKLKLSRRMMKNRRHSLGPPRMAMKRRQTITRKRRRG